MFDKLNMINNLVSDRISVATKLHEVRRVYSDEKLRALTIIHTYIAVPLSSYFI